MSCCEKYDVKGVKKLPENYTLKRWITKARSRVIYNFMRNGVGEDPKLQSTKWYRKLCMMLVIQ